MRSAAFAHVPMSLRARPEALLVVVAVLSCAAVALASLRHTGSIAFPIDDAYIYSNYVAQAATGHLFTYNPGETSGGITGLGWYLLCTLSYWLIAPLHVILGGLGPGIMQADTGLSQQAAHLYLAAYLAGVLCLAATGVGTYRLALLVLDQQEVNDSVRRVLSWLLGALTAADLGLVWGAMSGLEPALSSALAVWAITLLISDVRAGPLRWSLLLAALLPWARPDMLAISFGAMIWLGVRAFSAVGRSGNRQEALRNLALYVAAVVVGLAILSTTYYLGWGKPLPSSFYAKVGGLRLGTRFFSAALEMWIAGRVVPFVVAAITLVAGLAGTLPFLSRRQHQGSDVVETRRGALLLLLVSALYVVALMLTLPWFGQEDRYLLPIHPFVLVLLGGLVWRLFSSLPLNVPNPRSERFLLPLGIGVMLFLAGGGYVWATRNYVVEVRNITDAHIRPALWLSANTPSETIVASEPIGAVRLFSGRRTVDLVGLTTPATLGTYRDWPLAWPALRKAGAEYLVFYPAWFDDHKPPRWAVEEARFEIPDNRIAGDSVIAIYKLDWQAMGLAP